MSEKRLTSEISKGIYNICDDCFCDMECHGCTLGKYPLKKCPFCGSSSHYRRVGHNNDWLRVECSNRFGACVEMSDIYYDETCYEKLAVKWNNRACEQEHTHHHDTAGGIGNG